MTAQFARIAFLGFVGLTVVISYNALFLQDNPHRSLSAKKVHTKASSGRAQLARAANRPKTSSPSSSRVNMVKAIQRELQARDYDPGPVDGVAGTFTRAAIMAYQVDAGLPVTGATSGSLLEHIVLGESTGPLAEQTEIPDETVALIKKVQQFLKDQGLKPGPVDGILGSGTRRAVKSFERDRGLAETGRISGKLVRKITALAGAEFASVDND